MSGMPPFPTVVLDNAEVELADKKAKELVNHFKPKIVNSGRTGSQIPESCEDRLKTLYKDQLTGQLAQLAGALYMTGTDQLYRIQRWTCMSRPDLGDGGYDLPGLRLDWKGSRLKDGANPRNYRLIIRPKERKDEWTYCLVLVDLRKDCAYCHIMGWASDQELDGKMVDGTGIFSGAFVLDCKELHPLPKLRWDL